MNSPQSSRPLAKPPANHSNPEEYRISNFRFRIEYEDEQGKPSSLRISDFQFRIEYEDERGLRSSNPKLEIRNPKCYWGEPPEMRCTQP